ncbi:MAG: cache domain-containing protein [Rhodocyclaceae bacterium]|nr:cache domain-containing protein [Rhodocyclaceae bacterium]
MLILLPILIALLVVWGGDAYHRLLIYKVRSDLAVAKGYFERVMESVGQGVATQAASQRFASALANRDSRQVDAFLRAARDALQIDFLHFIGEDGRILATSSAQRAGVPAEPQTVIRLALQEKRNITALAVYSAQELAAIEPALAARAYIPLLPTANAMPTERTEENRGLVILSAALVEDSRGRFLGLLVGGRLLNRDLAFVDTLNEIIYPEGSLPFGGHGTATLFLDDVRIATNVRLFADERAIGTRVSQAVREAVLERGETWLDRAFVVNNWYVSAYFPLLDANGKRIGMLYVGYLEGPFAAMKRWALGGIAALFVLAALFATLLSIRWARKVFAPLERMDATMQAIENGQVSARVGDIASQDEIGRLAHHFDRLLDRLQSQQDELRRWGEALDAKVAERTAELERAYAELRATQRQLVMSEKLAAIGELTAGVAHEINNPIAVIQGNLDLIREVLASQAAPISGELRLIDAQIERIRLIVTKLLQFARPAEFAGYIEDVSPCELFSDCLVLVGHLLKRGNIVVTQRIETTRCAAINRNELQQVLINLLVNAIQALGDRGGHVTLVARDWNDGDVAQGIVIDVADDGPGIPPQHLDRIFDPFFSTKGTGGTGLGLSVSFGLVERYGGKITVDSTVGKGAVFHVWLPSEAPSC